MSKEVYRDDNMYILESDTKGSKTYTAHASDDDSQIAPVRHSLFGAKRAAEWHLFGDESRTYEDIYRAEAPKLPSGGTIPRETYWEHERAHVDLKHPFGGETNKERIRFEEEAWLRAKKNLEEQGKWTPEARGTANEALHTYYQGYLKLL